MTRPIRPVLTADVWLARYRLEVRFWRVARPDGDGWIWHGGRTGASAGACALHTRTLVGARRMADDLVYGPIPVGLHRCHRGAVPACVRPDHLCAGTRAQHMQDGARTGRWHNACRLTPAIARQMRVRSGAGGVTRAQVGEAFGSTVRPVSNIVFGTRWKETPQ